MKLSVLPPSLRSPVRLVLLVVALWFLITSLVRLPLISLDTVLPQTAWQLPHLVRLPVTFAFIGLTVWQWWRARQNDTGGVRGRALWLSLLILTIICCRWNTLAGFEHGDPDESESILAARTLLHDARFWVSVDVGTHGPIVSLWQTLLPRVGLAIDYASSRLLGALMLTVCVVCGYRILRRVATETNARLLTLPLVFAVAALTLPDLTAYNGEHPVILMAMLASACGLSALYVPRNDQNYQPGNPLQRLLLAGLCLGGIGWAKNQGLPIAFALAIAIGIACWRAPFTGEAQNGYRSRLRRLFWFGVGLVLPTLSILLWTLTSGAFVLMTRSYFQWNLAYATRFKDLNSLSTTIRTARWAVPAFVKMSRFSVIFHLAAVVGGIALLFQAARKNIALRGHGPLPGLLFTAAAVAGVAWLCAIKPGIEYLHYLMLPLLPTFLVYLLVWVPLLESGDSRTVVEELLPRGVGARLTRRTLSGFALILLGIAFPVTVWGFLRGPQGGPGGLVAPVHFSPIDSVDVVARTRSLTDPNDTIAVWGWMPSLYVNSDRRPATRTTACLREAVAALDLQPHFLNLWVTDLDQNRPVVFVDEVHKRAQNVPDARPSRILWMYGEMAQRIPSLPRPEDVDFRHEGYPSLASRIAERYRLMYTSPDGTRLYVRNDRADEAARRLSAFSP